MIPDSGLVTSLHFMRRCLQLALQGEGYVAPNPMVGAVLVHNGRIIGEGYHHKYGEAHAEVNCIASVSEADKQLIPAATLYVSLEPCAHFGKTPPCADLIIRHRIPRVVIGCRDPFKEVDGKGIERLKSAGIEVLVGILEEECRKLNRRFFIFHERQRPYIVLKWAETRDGFMAGLPGSDRLLISNEYANRIVHKWRGSEAAILVGTNTALADNPELTNRLWKGPSPVRLVIDKDLRLPADLKLFNGASRTIVFNTKKEKEGEGILYCKLQPGDGFLHELLKALYKLNIQSVLVEGGARLLTSFIEDDIWDEARIITNEKMIIGNGLPAPRLMHSMKTDEETILSDKITVYKPLH